MSDTDAYLRSLYSLDGRTAIVTGGTGVLGAAVAQGLASAGARVAVLGRDQDRAVQTVARIESAGGGAMPLLADVLSRDALESARDAVVERWGTIDILVCAAGGNVSGATTSPDRTFFDIEPDAFAQALDLNVMGTVLPVQVFGNVMAKAGTGCIVTFSSMSARRALTRVAGYAAGKAGMETFTRWLAVDLARRFGPGLRVNAVAPGFFVAEHNHDLLLREDNTPTERGEAILAHTPLGRFGQPLDLVSAVLWLCGPGAGFVTGTVIPIDGGFEAFSGV